MTLPFSRSSLVSALVGATALVMVPNAVHAEGKSGVSVTIPISFLGLNVGRMKSNISLDGPRYAVRGVVRTNRFVSIVADTEARFSSSGTVKGRSLTPISHALSFRQKRKKGSVELAFAGGNVRSSRAVPVIRYRSDAVPVTKNHLRAVLDPVSSIMLPVPADKVGNGKAVCNRTLPVFDGRSRMNLVLRYKNTKKARAKGFAGNVITCAVRYEPVAGHRPNRKNVKFMKANRNMEITVAQVGSRPVYALYGFRVKTQRGMASGSATRFQSN